MNATSRNGILLALLAVMLTASVSVPLQASEHPRRWTRVYEFDYVTWTLGALLEKAAYSALDSPRYLDAERQRQIVLTYLDVVREAQRVNQRLSELFANPDIADPERAGADLLEQQRRLEQALGYWGRLSEAVLEHQVSQVAADFGLTAGGQPLPPVAYRVTIIPQALIVSPREVIRQDANISLDPSLLLIDAIHLEGQVESSGQVSALVVPVGGVGVYPTMVMQSTNLSWLVETIAHEWIHNYLTLRPLGVLYSSTPELRTMNETTANLAGKEIGQEVLRRHYPEFLPPPQAEPPKDPGGEAEPPPETPEEPAVFSFQKEMHQTRVETDRLLAEGRIEEAEAFMEARRQIFVAHGYVLRRLNQAYFAFYGAYADAESGAFGSDPVGPLVRALRAESASLAAFIRQISWMTSFEQLERRVAG